MQVNIPFIGCLGLYIFVPFTPLICGILDLHEASLSKDQLLTECCMEGYLPKLILMSYKVGPY